MIKWFCFFLLVMVSGVRAQKFPEFDISSYKHTITYPDYKVTFQAKEIAVPIKQLDAAKSYHWYSNNAIQVTQGGYRGKLLDGLYTAYFLNGNLKEQGSYEMGLKEGQWDLWDENGLLLSKVTFRQGQLNGEFSNYQKGKLVEAGTYYKGKLNGVVKKYDANDSLTVARYRDGKILEPVKKSKWFKKIFNKKNN